METINVTVADESNIEVAVSESAEVNTSVDDNPHTFVLGTRLSINGQYKERLDATANNVANAVVLRGSNGRIAVSDVEVDGILLSTTLEEIRRYELSIGNVSVGEAASASITGTHPTQSLNLVLPRGTKIKLAESDEVSTSDLINGDFVYVKNL